MKFCVGNNSDAVYDVTYLCTFVRSRVFTRTGIIGSWIECDQENAWAQECEVRILYEELSDVCI